jgi:hypothetical protein
MSSSENSSSNPFKDRFENWEGPVRPDFWNDMEKNLEKTPNVPSMKPGIWGWISGIILLGGIGAGVFWNNSVPEKTKAVDDVQISHVQSEKPTAKNPLPGASVNPALPYPESSRKTESARKQNTQRPESEATFSQAASAETESVPESNPSVKTTLQSEKERQPSKATAFVLDGASSLPPSQERETQNRVKARSEKQILAASGKDNPSQHKSDKPESEPILISGIRENGETAAASSHTEAEIPVKRIDPINENEGKAVLSFDGPARETPAANQNEGSPLNQVPMQEEKEQIKPVLLAQQDADSGKPTQADSVQVAEQKTMPLLMESPKKPRSADSSQSRKRLSFWAGVSLNGVSRQMKLFRRPEEFFGKESRGLKQFRTSPTAGLHLTGNLDCFPWLALRLDVAAMTWLETVEYQMEAGQSAERQYNSDQQDSTLMLVQPKISPRNELSSSWNGLLGMMPELDFHPEGGAHGLRLGNRFQWILRNPTDSRFQLWTPGLAFYRKNKKWDGEIRMHFYRQEEKSPRILPESRAEIRQILWGFTLRRRL